MTTGTWEPENQKKQYSIDMKLLHHIISFMREHDDNDISTCLTAAEQEQHISLMTVEKKQWPLISQKLSDDEILLLIKFFTLAEMQITAWVGEQHSPVIWLAKAYRQRGKALDKSLLQWIKQTSDNKFLPYGSL